MDYFNSIDMIYTTFSNMIYTIFKYFWKSHLRTESKYSNIIFKKCSSSKFANFMYSVHKYFLDVLITFNISSDRS